MMPDCGAYSIRPYPDGRLFSSEWVGRKSIRPIRRSRQGNERKHPVLPTITQRQPPDLDSSCFSSVRVTLKTYGFLFFVRMGRGVLHTPLQTFLSREQMQVAGSANNHPKTTARALSCPIGGRMQYAPTLTAPKNMIIF